MKITIRLVIHKPAKGACRITAPAFGGLVIHARTLESCRDQIAILAASQLAEMPEEARNLCRARPDERLEMIEVDVIPLVVPSSPAEPLHLSVHLLLTPLDDGTVRVIAPGMTDPPVGFFVSHPAQLKAVARSHVILYCQDLKAKKIRALQADPSDTLEEMEIDFTPRELQEEQSPEEEPEQEKQPTELDAVGIELTAKAHRARLSQAYGREAEVDRVLHVLAGARPSLVLVGPPGAGKTAIVQEVVRRICLKQCDESLRTREVWRVTGSTLIAGQKYIGEIEARVQRTIEAARTRKALLFVDNIAGLVDTGRHEQNEVSVADDLRPHVQDGSVVIIGETTPERWRYAERRSPSFVAQFAILRIEPTRGADTLFIVNSVLAEIEQREQIRFGPGAAEVAIDLTDRFLPYHSQPGKAIQLIQRSVSDYLQQPVPQDAQRPALGRKEVLETLTRETGLPEFILADDVPLDLAAVRRHFADRVVGQEEAVDAMVDLIALIKAGLNDPEKPLGSFLFIGTTGVGKTQMVKTLAKYLFGHEERVIRLDMSELADASAAQRLIGWPGVGGSGELTGRVREQPFCVVLLDEFEKAAPEIHDLFLQVLGEGRLTDGTGATVSFQNAIIVMTSNLGASAREQRTLGLVAEGSEDAGRDLGYWRSKVEGYFRPEFVNRIDRIVPFRQLGPETMRQIARRELGEVLLRQGVARRNLLVEMDDGIIDLLLEQGFSVAYGARPLKRAIEQRVVVPLARFLAGYRGTGSDLLRLGCEGDHITLTVIGAGCGEGQEQGVLEDRPARRDEQSRLLNYSGLIDGYTALREKLVAWATRADVLRMRHDRDHLLTQTSQPTFWDDQAAAQATLARFYFVERLLKRLQQLTEKATYLEELARLVQQQRDAGYRWDLAENYEQLARDVAYLEVELLCAPITGNRNALLTIAPMPRQLTDKDSAAWVSQLAAMYLSWANRKSYDIEAVASLGVIPEAQRASEAQWAYPFRWQHLDVGDCDKLGKAVVGLTAVREIAIVLSGANVYGFLKGEAGLHRLAGRRATDGKHGVQEERGSQGQQFGAVTVDTWDGDGRAALDALLQARAIGKSERNAAPAATPSDIVRNYHLDGPRFVRDPRTGIRHSDPNAVLAGHLDDFILAYLRKNADGTSA